MRLEVLAYNVCACPMHFGHFVTWRPPAPWRFREGLIAERLVDYDVVGLAEMFLPDADHLRRRLAAPTHVVGPGARPLVPLSSGVEVASKLRLAPVGAARSASCAS